MQNEDIVEVKIKKREISLLVWLFPIIALIAGGWMVYKYYSRLGPKIEIFFKNSGGLEPKQSYVKFREVKVGVVEKIEILKEKEGVVVTVRMNKDIEPFLNETTKFWIVKPEIGLGRVRGLDALVSGSYIRMHAKAEGKSRQTFTGLEEPPLNPDKKAGSTFVLKAANSYDLSAGLGVYFRQFRVGTIEKVALNDKMESQIYIFVRSPYDKFVTCGSRFWSLGGADFELKEGELKVEAGSLNQILLGGVEFDTLISQEKGCGEFYLYPSKNEALRKRANGGVPLYETFKLSCQEVGSLRIGDKVKFLDIEVGYVKDIKTELDLLQKSRRFTLYLDIDTKSFGQEGDKRFKEALKRGLYAEIASQSMIFDSSFVDLKYSSKFHGSFPCKKEDSYSIKKAVENIVKKLETLPLKETVLSYKKIADENAQNIKELLERLKESSRSLDNILKSKDTAQLPQKISQLIEVTRQTLTEYKKLAQTYSDDSVFVDRVSQTLKDIDSASKELEKFLQKLKKDPSMLIFGE